MHPRPPLDLRLRPAHRVALQVLAGVSYGLVAWALFGHDITPRWAAVLGTVLVSLPLAICRQHPAIALASALAGFWADPVAPLLPFLALVPMAYVLYRIADRYRPRVTLPALAVALTGPVATATTGHAGGVIPFGAVLVLAWTFGYARGEHRRYDRELVDHHAGMAEAERERGRRGVAEERMRIARDLHDAVAHSMSVITVQAGYAQLVIDEKPAEARAALTAIETTGRQTLAEMRQLLGLLRENDELLLSPTPGLADLPQLVPLPARAGVHVDLVVTGRPELIPAGIGLAAYRIIQESLTNVVKHAGASTARVNVDCRRECVDIEVTDDGLGGPVTPGGLGLQGMGERARVYGGRVDAAPRSDGGFRVTARLPLPDVEPAR